MDRAGSERVGVRGPARDRGCWSSGAEGIRRAPRRRPPPGHPGSPCGWLAAVGRPGGRQGWRPSPGAGWWLGRPPLCPPDIAAAPAGGGRDVATAGLAVPATPSPGGVWTGLFSYPLESVGWILGSRVLPSLFPFLRPAHFAPFLLAMLVVLLSGIGCFLGRSLPARNAPLQS